MLSLDGLGDRKPLELMEHMLALVSSGDVSFLFTHLFLRQLLPAVHTVLATSPRIQAKDYRSLAEEADRLLLATRHYSVHALLPGVPQGGSEIAAVAAVSEQQKDDGLCFYHRRFGVKARRCIPPSSFRRQGNERAGTH